MVSRRAAEIHALQILEYPHPTLRRVCKPLRRVDAELAETVRAMFTKMYEARGIGLAASQVGLPYRLVVINAEAEPDKGEELVLINPVLSRPKGNEEEEEGCLSLPGLYAPVRRPAKIHLSAFTLAGEEVSAEIEGLLARVVQHEVDHLDGVLFIDRISQSATAELRDSLAQMEHRFAERCERGEIPDDERIAEELAAIEERYC